MRDFLDCLFVVDRNKLPHKPKWLLKSSSWVNRGRMLNSLCSSSMSPSINWYEGQFRVVEKRVIALEQARTSHVKLVNQQIGSYFAYQVSPLPAGSFLLCGLGLVTPTARAYFNGSTRHGLSVEAVSRIKRAWKTSKFTKLIHGLSIRLRGRVCRPSAFQWDDITIQYKALLAQVTEMCCSLPSLESLKSELGVPATATDSLSHATEACISWPA